MQEERAERSAMRGKEGQLMQGMEAALASLQESSVAWYDCGLTVHEAKVVASRWDS